MIALVVYGSLMHPDEHVALAADGVATFGEPVPVRVRGFRRSFSQEPSWRRGEGLERGVLTVRPSPGHWFNGVLITGCDESMVARLDERERGYRRIRLELSQVDAYAGHVLDATPPEVHVYVGRDEQWNEVLRPNSHYQSLCTTAAAAWGDGFLNDFLETTCTD